MELKYFEKNSPPILKIGELATDGEYLFMGINNGKILRIGFLDISLEGGFSAGEGTKIDKSNYPTEDLNSGVALGLDAFTEGSGAALGEKAHTVSGLAAGDNTRSYAGVAAGLNAKSATGGAALGRDTETVDGAAVGNGASSSTGGAVGKSSETVTGGAVGALSKSVTGFAGGKNTTAVKGVALGENATATQTEGIAIGRNSNSPTGVAIGDGAITGEGTGKNTVQLGTGTNANGGTLQFREYTLLNNVGRIPIERIHIPELKAALGI